MFNISYYKTCIYNYIALKHLKTLDNQQTKFHAVLRDLLIPLHKHLCVLEVDIKIGFHEVFAEI